MSCARQSKKSAPEKRSSPTAAPAPRRQRWSIAPIAKWSEWVVRKTAAARFSLFASRTIQDAAGGSAVEPGVGESKPPTRSLTTSRPSKSDPLSAIAPVVCAQNFYNIANRRDDALIDSLAKQRIGYVPFFPLGGFTPLQSETLSNVAARLNAKPMSVALAWLLQRSPNILLIPGTSSVEHLRENVAGADLQLPHEAIKELNHAALRQSNSRVHY